MFAIVNLIVCLMLSQECTFVQQWDPPELYAGSTCYFYPYIVSGSMECNGVYAYSFNYTVDGYKSITYIGLGKKVPKWLPIWVQEDAAGKRLTLWTEFKCLKCGHKSIYTGSAIIKQRFCSDD